MTRGEVVNKISEILKELAPDALKLLFGSEARGESRPDSDFDILIVLPEDGGIEFEKKKSRIFDRLYDVELISGMTVSPLIVPHKIWEERRTPFTINVINEGKRI